MKITREEFLKAIETVNNYEIQLKKEILEAQKFKKNISPFAGVSPETNILDTGLSVRAINILKHGLGLGKVILIKDLSHWSVNDLLRLRLCGKATIDEIQELCKYAGVTLKE